MGVSGETTVVVGAQWGDEGKGKIVDVLSPRVDWVARYQGGANAGHTVIWGDEKFVLHQLPSGVMQGVPCVLGNGVVIDPETLLAEIDGMEARGIRVPRILVSDRAHIVLPFHKILDQGEASRSIGTTGRGIGPAYEDKVARRGVRVGDLRYPLKLREKIGACVRHHAQGLEDVDDSIKQALDAISQVAARILAMAGDVGVALAWAQERGESILLEGAQGSLLDLDHGTYPYVTSSNTTAGGACVGVGISPLSVTRCLGVVKAYSTRVGHGPLPTELDEPLQSRLREAGGEWGATTGRARRCGWFDSTVVRYARRINGLTDLALTKLDVLDSFETVRICTAYKIDGEIVSDFPGDLEKLARAEPVYEDLRGWQSATGQCREFGELPVEAQRYIARIEELVKGRVCMVSVGRDRGQIIERR